MAKSYTSAKPAMNAFGRTHSFNDELNSVQDRIEDFLSQVENSIIIDGRLLPDISLVSGSTTKVEHNLGRVPSGFITVDASVNVTVWQPTDADSANLNLQSSVNAIVSLWVF